MYGEVGNYLHSAFAQAKREQQQQQQQKPDIKTDIISHLYVKMDE